MMDGQIKAGDIVVSRANGTLETYIIGEVAVGDWPNPLKLTNTTATVGRTTALAAGYKRQQHDSCRVWLFDGPTGDPSYIAAPRPCACGCGGFPKGTDSKFLPGHDLKKAYQDQKSN